MKRIGGLYDSIADRYTFSVAVHRAAQGKRQRSDVKAYLSNLDAQLQRTISQLRAGEFRFAAYHEFRVRDTKSRTIHAPAFGDRVVHHAMIHVLGPVFEMGAYHHSYACRAGKGHHAAIQQARTWSRSGDWFLKLDIEKFYDSVDHDMLRLLLRRRFREERLLRLFNSLLRSYESSPGKGIPIGALTSQYLGNFYLDSVDRWAKQTMRIPRYARYMDDMVFWGSQQELRAVWRHVHGFLESMQLRLNSSPQLNRCDLGLPFLGFVVYPDRLRLNRLGKRRLRRRVRALERRYLAGDSSETELQERVQSMFAHAAIADDAGWRRVVARGTLLGES